MMRLVTVWVCTFLLVNLVSTPASSAERVDLELVLAVDASRSMDRDEKLLQRRGYVEAFRSPDVINAITGGGFGKIAVAYLEWAGYGSTRVVVDWTLIDSKEAALAFATRLESDDPQRLSRTSISNAIHMASDMFGTSPWQGLRRVIDVSGDGPNNHGHPITSMRDAIVAKGVIINGLPLMIRNSTFGFGIENLDEYYADCVIGGTGAFVLPVYSWEKFPEAVRRKLVLEIAGAAEPVLLHRASDDSVMAPGEGRPRVDCMIGEKLWYKRMQEMEWR